MYLQIRKLSVNALLVDKNRGEPALIFPGNPTEKCYSRVYIYQQCQFNRLFTSFTRKRCILFKQKVYTFLSNLKFLLGNIKVSKNLFQQRVLVFWETRTFESQDKCEKKTTLSNTNFDRKVDITRLTITNVSSNEINITKIYL